MRNGTASWIDKSLLRTGFIYKQRFSFPADVIE
jgi:hypothetical protein